MSFALDKEYLDPFDNTPLRDILQQRLHNAVFGEPGQENFLFKPTMIGSLSTLIDVDHTSMLYKAIEEALETEDAQERYDFFENLAEWVMDEATDRISKVFQDGERRRSETVWQTIISDRANLRKHSAGSTVV